MIYIMKKIKNNNMLILFLLLLLIVCIGILYKLNIKEPYQRNRFTKEKDGFYIITLGDGNSNAITDEGGTKINIRPREDNNTKQHWNFSYNTTENYYKIKNRSTGKILGLNIDNHVVSYKENELPQNNSYKWDVIINNVSINLNPIPVKLLSSDTGKGLIQINNNSNLMLSTSTDTIPTYNFRWVT